MSIAHHPTYFDGSGRPLVLYMDLEEDCPICRHGSLWVQHHDRPNYHAHCNHCDHIEYRDTGSMRFWARLEAVKEEAGL